MEAFSPPQAYKIVEQNGSTTRLMIDATHLKAHRTTASLLKKRAFPAVLDTQKVAWTQNSMLFAMPPVSR